MKKITVLILTILIFIGCSSDDKKSQESYIFRNSTDFIVTVKPFKNLLDGAPDFEFTIPKGESKTYQSDYMYGAFDVSSTESTWCINYKINGDTRVIYAVEATVKYKITGSANKVNLTYATPNNGTVQKTVSLPYEIKFCDFGTKEFKYISAQNDSGNGSILVELFVEDNLKDFSSCSGGGCIATAQN